MQNPAAGLPGSFILNAALARQEQPTLTEGTIADARDASLMLNSLGHAFGLGSRQPTFAVPLSVPPR